MDPEAVKHINNSLFILQGPDGELDGVGFFISRQLGITALHILDKMQPADGPSLEFVDAWLHGGVLHDQPEKLRVLLKSEELDVAVLATTIGEAHNEVVRI
jgi:hypothetical protein